MSDAARIAGSVASMYSGSRASSGSPLQGSSPSTPRKSNVRATSVGEAPAMRATAPIVSRAMQGGLPDLRGPQRGPRLLARRRQQSRGEGGQPQHVAGRCGLRRDRAHGNALVLAAADDAVEQARPGAVEELDGRQ